MLLRRLTKHVKDQNWFAVGLDFFIVVVGILIAFQITNWSTARGDRLREAQILEDIATDIAADIEGYELAIDSALIRIATINYVFESTPNAAVSDPLATENQLELGVSWTSDIEEAAREDSHGEDFSFEEYAAAAKQSLWSYAILVGNVEKNATALDALVNSGDLGILGNKEIVRQLQEYRLITSAIEKSQDVTFRPSRDAAIGVGHKFGLSVHGTVDEEAFLELISTEPELAATLQSQLGWATGHYLMLAGANQSAHELLENIQSELGVTPAPNGGDGS